MENTQVLAQAIHAAHAADGGPVMVAYAEDGTADVCGPSGFHAMIGYNVVIGPDGNGTIVYDAPGAPQVRIGE